MTDRPLKYAIDIIRHSTAHIMAAAVLELFPDTKFGIGPVIENGFYYDFDCAQALTPQDLLKIEKRMRKIIERKEKFTRKEMEADEAIKFFKEQGQDYKVELIEDIKKYGTTELSPTSPLPTGEGRVRAGDGGGGSNKVSIYETGKFSDLCRGPHIEHTGQVGAFKLTTVAGAYWRGSEKNKMLTRIYGVAFANKEELDGYLNMLAEAKKRDHRKLGVQLGLFTFSELVGSGLPLFLPKGNVVKTELEKFVRSEKEARGYSFVSIPHIAKVDLYKKSGHLGKYDAMMPIMTDEEGGQYVMKAMNCPHHFEIYNSEPHSYRDLPYRIAENTAVYRNEKSGELSGLVRVKSITQDDTHHIVRHDQIEAEISMIIGLMENIYKPFDFKDFLVQISVRDPSDKAKYFGDDKLWEKSEAILIAAVKKWGKNYVVEEGEAAFYGPKIDIMVKDSLGRQWQLTTVQLDFNQPENFHMRYAGEDGKEHAPAVLHVAILGAVERFMGILIEHYAGAFPVWLAPVQVYIGSVGKAHASAVRKLGKLLNSEGFRVQADDGNDTVGYKIRQAEKQKIPYMLVVGDKEKSLRKLTVRIRGQQKQPQMSVSAFVKRIKMEIEKKK